MEKKFGPLAIISVAVLGLLFILLFQPKILKMGEETGNIKDNSFSGIKSANLIRVGSALEELPWGTIDQTNGEKIGGEVEIAKMLASELGVGIEIVNRGFDFLIPELLSKKFDVIIAGISITDERKEKIAFSDPYFKTGQVIVVKDDNKEIADETNLEGKIIGVLSGTTSQNFANTIPNVKEVRVYDNPGQYYEDTKSGKIDATIYDQPAAYWYTKNSKGLKIVGNLLTSEYYALGLRKEDVELKSRIDTAISKIIKTEQYKKIIADWYGTNL